MIVGKGRLMQLVFKIGKGPVVPSVVYYEERHRNGKTWGLSGEFRI